MKKYFLCFSLGVLGMVQAQDTLAVFKKAMEQKELTVTQRDKSLAKESEADVLVISCVDFRLRNETWRLMEKKLKLLDNYDEFAVPGAALAFVEPTKKNWNETTKDVIAALKKLHSIKHVVFLDHRGCDAYKLLKGKASISTPEKETVEHKKVFALVRKKMKKEFPNLKVHTLLMGVDGKIEIFKGDDAKKAAKKGVKKAD